MFWLPQSQSQRQQIFHCWYQQNSKIKTYQNPVMKFFKNFTLPISWSFFAWMRNYPSQYQNIFWLFLCSLFFFVVYLNEKKSEWHMCIPSWGTSHVYSFLGYLWSNNPEVWLAKTIKVWQHYNLTLWTNRNIIGAL